MRTVIARLSGVAAALLLALGGAASAFAPDTSARPQARTLTLEQVADTAATVPSGLAVTRSLRPVARTGTPRAQTPVQATVQPHRANPAAFNRWVADFRRRALRQGIPAQVFDRAFAEAEYLSVVIERDRRQSEFTKQLWEYLDTAVSDSRVRNGRSNFRAQERTLRRIEATYGVDAQVVAAIWGLESAYGTFRGDTNTISAMATLAFDGRRKRFFEAQLMAALRILAAGDTDMRHMRGSWAGAMGHTQFMPDSFLSYAVDFTGDGRRDIWGDDPTDALASTANYLRAHGWRRGQPWGMEVQLPRNFDYSQTGERIKKSVAAWMAAGVRRIDGSAIPDHGRASVLVPAGAQGAAFLIFDNFHVIERYNPADAYVIAVGHLGDRILGGGTIRAGWPRGDRALSFDEKVELQRLLTAAGHPPGKIDGIIGPNTIEAVRRYQRGQGLIPDGYVSLDILRRLR